MLGLATVSREPMSSNVPGDDERWAAVLRRDAAFDGAFYYSVKSTGVFCRPSCPSRRPRRENVAFHERPEDAERLGFRPCRRCRPTAPALSERQAKAIARACALLDATDESPSLQRIAREVGMSRFHFQRVFKAVTGVTPKAYATARRADRVRQLLPTRATVTAALYDAGFNSGGRFYASAGAVLGMKPGTFRTGGQGEVIRFAVATCSLGKILVAATAKGVCAITFGNDTKVLVRELEKRFPHARIVAGDRAFEALVAEVVGAVEQPSRPFELPLDVRGTAFQQRVWHALRETLPGTRVTYSDIARRIGAPGAVRAVARACASNPVAVVIPCHRVVRKDGSTGGYRWGPRRKQALLDREAASPARP
jgi:AraC family transcriptional regulator of adaptative response/methylated-DNA-[protein]-cysteine methyltransferase